MNPEEVSRFLDRYYSTFGSNPAALVNLYQEGSMLSFQGQHIQGSQNIVAHLTSLPFQQCRHTITAVDCQPSGLADGMLVFVSGHLQPDGPHQALNFSQMFHLIRSPQGSFCMQNDIFRLNYEIPPNIFRSTEESVLFVGH